MNNNLLIVVTVISMSFLFFHLLHSCLLNRSYSDHMEQQVTEEAAYYRIDN